jgi:hypothetical protein
MESIARRRVVLGVGFAVAGGCALIGLFLVQDVPEPLWLWAILAAFFVALDYSAVEVNDRLFVSSAVMVAFAAAVVFGRQSAVLAAVLMVVPSILHPQDLKRRQWSLALANFGQFVVSMTLAITVFWLFLPAGEITRNHLPVIITGAAVAAIVYDWLSFRIVAIATRVLYPERDVRPWTQLLPNHLALSVLAVLGAVLGVAYLVVGPVILPIGVFAFGVGQIAFASYAQLREAHEATIRGVVKAVEALDPYTRGHSERVAYFIDIAAAELDLPPERVQRLRWAALIHGMGRVAVPPSLLHTESRLTADENARVERHMRVVEELLANVRFLVPMVEIVAGSRTLAERSDASLEERLFAAADRFDTLTTARSYRAAVTQMEAFDELRQRADEFGSEVVEALITAITGRGEVYGSPDEASAAEVERLVRERAMRA